MGIFNRRRKQKRSSVAFASDLSFESLRTSGYTSLDNCPEVMAGVERIAKLIASMTIHLMANTNKGDIRIVNELSRCIDINPMPTMTRSVWMESIIMNLLLYGKGNSIVLPHTDKGYLIALEPIKASRVSFAEIDSMHYNVLIDNKPHSSEDVLHFVYNPDKNYLWKGTGINVLVSDLANVLKQASTTEKAFMASKYRPSIIVKVDALTDEFASKEGRKKLLESYMDTSETGEPWIIPSEQFSVEQVRPLTLADLAIADTVKMTKEAVASLLGIPAFVLGVGTYNKDEWNNFIEQTIRPIAVAIQQEMTKKLIISEKMYLRFNILSLKDWDLQTIAGVFCQLSDRGFVTGNEVRDRVGLAPKDDLDELRILENYIPASMSGEQNKLKG